MSEHGGSERASLSGYGWTHDGMYPFWPGVPCLHCGRFVGRDGIFNYETWEMSNEVASLDAEHRECAHRYAAALSRFSRGDNE